MNTYLDIFINAYKGYADYLWREISFQVSPIWKNYFWMLVLVSGIFFLLEVLRPWRENQARFRKDFWLDFFYMFFNFFLFSLIIYNASSEVIVRLFNNGIISLTGFDLQASNPMQYWPYWAILLTGFLVRDFIQWWVHRLLHKSPSLWEFHKVHHSVEQMGFAAHLRYHWMENVVYRSLEYIPLALLGIGLHDFFLIHIFYKIHTNSCNHHGGTSDQQCIHGLALEKSGDNEPKDACCYQLGDDDEEIENPHVDAHFMLRDGTGKDSIRHGQNSSPGNPNAYH